MDEKDSPKLVNRREHRKSTFRMGRTIGEKREKLETANERAAARKKDKKKKATRIALTVVGFLVLVGILITLAVVLINESKPSDISDSEQNETAEVYEPTIEIIDEDNSAGQITGRMSAYIGQTEYDFRELGYRPVKAVIPSGAVREVDFYLEGRPGFVKLIIDRATAISVEDADRMMRYLESIGVEQYEYIDVRIEGKAFWK